MKKDETFDSRFTVSVYTHARRDAEITADVLVRAGFRAQVISDLGTLVGAMPETGAVILSEEVLSKEVLEKLDAQIEKQPRWSDLPIIVVTSAANSTAESHERLERMASYLHNLTLLERPIRLATLITIVRTSLASRKKQFELKGILEELEKAKVAAEAANEAKTMFLANMSHEIRTPLAAIIGFASLLQDQALPTEERLNFTDVISRNGEQLSSLINDILDLSKVEAGKLEIDRTVLPLPAFVTEITSLLRPTVESKGLAFAVELLTALPPVVKADATRIRQVLLNLVSNAAKFTQAGHVKLTVRAEKSVIKFEVTDTGIGMSEQDQTRLFQPFSQADSSVTRRYGGTGLGLVLSKALAQAMGGDLTLLESTPQKGSRFLFSLPLEEVSEIKNVKAEKIPEHALAGMKVLVAEDSADNQFLMNRYLKSAGADVQTADNGRSAADAALKNPFDVILMDVQMPIMDGLSATRELRERGYTAPIIALTAHAMREERDRSLSAGCDAHLTKPIDRELLISTLASFRPRRS